MEYWVLAYYAIEKIENPHDLVAHHKEFLSSLDFRGRIYISQQGINGQSSGSISHAKQYMDWLRSDPRFARISFKVHPALEHPFPKMTVKYRKQLVAIDAPVDFSQRAEPISPAIWKKMLENRSPQTLLLDVRNDYEWKAGHFEGAELPKLEQFRHFPEYARQLKLAHDPATVSVMMYCTGGIRCEFFSAFLKQEGFQKVYQLDGGVIQYGLEEGGDHWLGKLFVFDDRLVIPLDERKDIIALCSFCKTKNDVYYNCANMDCNALFFSCLNCLREHKGCCSDSCQDGRVRPFKENAKPFRKRAAERCDCST